MRNGVLLSVLGAALLLGWGVPLAAGPKEKPLAVDLQTFKFKFKDGLAGNVIPGCPVDTNPGQIDRGGFRQFGESVRDLHDVVSVCVLRVRSVDPGPGFGVHLSELIALEENDCNCSR